MNDSKYLLKHTVPEVAEYLTLRKACGHSLRGTAASKIGLSNSLFAVTVRRTSDQTLVGMGRLIGDRGTAYQILDIAVLPEDQGNGLAKSIMSAIMNHIHNEVDPQAYVNLIADCPAENLYQQFGFVETAPKSIGMYLKR